MLNMQGMVAYDPTEEMLFSAELSLALAKLTPEQRLALELAVAEVGIRAMAKELRLSVFQTRALLNSAIARMRELLHGWQDAGTAAE